MVDSLWPIWQSLFAMNENGKDLSAKQVVSWLRNQASQFNRMADQIESAFNLHTRPDSHTPSLPALNTIPVEAVWARITEKSSRIADLAKHFGVHEAVIRQIVEDPTN